MPLVAIAPYDVTATAAFLPSSALLRHTYRRSMFVYRALRNLVSSSILIGAGIVM